MQRLKFFLGYSLKRPEVINAYREIKRNENKSLDFLVQRQNKQLIKLINFAVEQVPYYRKLFSDYKLNVDDIQTVQDLVKIPILTKEIIKKDPESFIPMNYTGKYVNGSTGGSTGVPLKYRMSNKDYSRGTALLIRGFEMGGYEIGDKMSIIAGASLVSKKQPLKSKMQDFLLNFHHYSSYGMGEEDLYKFYLHLKMNQSRFLRGYASSLYLFAKYLIENNLSLGYQLKGIFSTSEKLLPNQRKVIEEAFETQVFDNYGLNDGGISAFECQYHNGMHIDFDRSILEITNISGNEQLVDKEGKILATSLYNYATPFIRYDTGDLGIISAEECTCGSPRPLLKEVTGRVTDYLKLNNIYVGSPVLTVLMGKVDAEYYQIVQTAKNQININLIKGKSYSSKDEVFIKQSFIEHVGEIKINFTYLDNSELLSLQKNKHKFIVNESFK